MSAEMEDLIERWLEGSLDSAKQDVSAKQDELAAWLKEHPEHMQQFVEANVRQQMLCDVARGELVADEVQEIAPIPVESARRSTTRIVAFVASIAACLLIAFGWLMRTERGVQQVEPFSSVAMVRGDGSGLKVGDRLSADTIEIESGIVRLLFDDGVEVTLQGPAHFELIEPGRTRLLSGLLAATVPPGAEGFRVDTPGAQVVDLGTAFGIDQRLDGTSKVSVFDGEVEIVSRKKTGKRLLTEGESIQLDADGSVNEVEFAAQQFQKLWPTASGITGSTGAFRFAPQWPRRLRKIESDNDIFVLPEGYAKKLNQPCLIDRDGNELSESVIPAGQRVRSFLLQFNPVDPGDREPNNSGRNGRRIEGSITFDRPVIGLIIKTETLKTTDELFSLNRAGGGFGRGLELGQGRIADVVSLSEDRRTLTLDLFVVNRLSDHVRVIVDAELNQ